MGFVRTTFSVAFSCSYFSWQGKFKSEWNDLFCCFYSCLDRCSCSNVKCKVFRQYNLIFSDSVCNGLLSCTFMCRGINCTCYSCLLNSFYYSRVRVGMRIMSSITLLSRYNRCRTWNVNTLPGSFILLFHNVDGGSWCVKIKLVNDMQINKFYFEAVRTFLFFPFSIEYNRTFKLKCNSFNCFVLLTHLLFYLCVCLHVFAMRSETVQWGNKWNVLCNCLSLDPFSISVKNDTL